MCSERGTIDSSVMIRQHEGNQHYPNDLLVIIVATYNFSKKIPINSVNLVKFGYRSKSRPIKSIIPFQR